MINYIFDRTHTLYMQQVPEASLKIEDILFQELPTNIDDNRWKSIQSIAITRTRIVSIAFHRLIEAIDNNRLIIIDYVDYVDWLPMSKTISCMSVALWLLNKKCSDRRLWAVSLFVNRSAIFVEAVFKSTFGFSYVLFVKVVTLYHVDTVFELQSMWWLISLVSVLVEFNVYSV